MPPPGLIGVLIISSVLVAFAAATDFGLRSCCDLSREELEAATGTSDECPTTKSVSDINKCDSCPPGTCRVDSDCFCPGAFLESFDDRESYGAWNYCESSFGEKWPESIGKEDVDWRSCQDGVQVTDFGTKSCCDLSREELEAATGTSDECPTTKSVSDINKCDSCPPGTCRVDSDCFCPGAFLESFDDRESYGAWNYCESSFGEKWPESIGKEDVDWRSCEKKDPVTTEKSNPSSSPGSSGETGSGSDSSTDKGDDEENDGEADDETEDETDPDGENNADKDNGGINWEMWGGILGGIGTLATIAFGIVGLKYSRRHRSGSQSSGPTGLKVSVQNQNTVVSSADWSDSP